MPIYLKRYIGVKSDRRYDEAHVSFSYSQFDKFREQSRIALLAEPCRVALPIFLNTTPHNLSNTQHLH